VCQGVTNAFSLDGSQPANGYTDSKCTADYIAIPGTKSTFISKIFFIDCCQSFLNQVFVTSSLIIHTNAALGIMKLNQTRLSITTQHSR